MSSSAANGSTVQDDADIYLELVGKYQEVYHEETMSNDRRSHILGELLETERSNHHCPGISSTPIP